MHPTHLLAGIATGALAPSLLPLGALYYVGGVIDKAAVDNSRYSTLVDPAKCDIKDPNTVCGNIFAGFTYGIGYWLASRWLNNWFPQ